MCGALHAHIFNEKATKPEEKTEKMEEKMEANKKQQRNTTEKRKEITQRLLKNNSKRKQATKLIVQCISTALHRK